MIHRHADLVGDLLITQSFKAEEAKDLALLWMQIGQGFAQMLGQLAGFRRLYRVGGAGVGAAAFWQRRATVRFATPLAQASNARAVASLFNRAGQLRMVSRLATSSAEVKARWKQSAASESWFSMR